MIHLRLYTDKTDDMYGDNMPLDKIGSRCDVMGIWAVVIDVLALFTEAVEGRGRGPRSWLPASSTITSAYIKNRPDDDYQKKIS